ncbi:hypothetical protein F0562_013877 [Nyssa sinensis]|uniref:Uncharacterized protein n=1 Tax=Nyssa sinensis TaxID=561372 RepID=A0A5J4ZPR7_9ASTE|nr:hypothetical protein F0562_013877 [Nyssa sinensis]
MASSSSPKEENMLRSFWVVVSQPRPRMNNLRFARSASAMERTASNTSRWRTVAFWTMSRSCSMVKFKMILRTSSGCKNVPQRSSVIDGECASVLLVLPLLGRVHGWHVCNHKAKELVSGKLHKRTIYRVWEWASIKTTPSEFLGQTLGRDLVKSLRVSD